jgi:hypothetical protein
MCFSFSDWKLEIKIRHNFAKKVNDAENDQNPSTLVDRTYYVHRTVLAIGERRSGYFANLLHYGIDDGNRCSTIELSSRAADTFPDLLDFMYLSKGFALTSRNAIALLFLSQAFQVVALETRVKLFIDKDIKLGNFGYYMSDALHFSDETMAIKVINTCEKEAILLMNNSTPRVDLTLRKILKVRRQLPPAIKVETFWHNIWTFLTHEQPPFHARKKMIQSFLRRKAPP